MDLFDSPLNLAHQQSRKADKYLKSERYEEAIECHRKAADYLTKAMAATTIQQALESLSLQRESHIRQQAIIREKQRRALLVKSPDGSGKAKTSKTPSEERSQLEGEVTSEKGSHAGTSVDDELNTTVVYRTLDECDSLLQFLNNRGDGGKECSLEEWRAGHKSGDNTSPPGVNGNHSNSHTRKNNETIIEELRIHNDALRNHVVQFLKQAEEQQRQVEYYQRELEYSRKETRDLKDRLSKVEHPNVHRGESGGGQSETFYTMPIALNLDKLPSLELPPLEMPKFDFDSLKSNPEEETLSSSVSQ